METFLTTLSNFLTFLQQHFFPSFIFVTLNEFILFPALSRALSRRGMISASLPSDLLTKLGLAFIIAVVLGYALENFNIPLAELFQGEPLREHRYGKWLTKRQRSRRDSLVQKINNLYDLKGKIEEQVDRLMEEREDYETGAPEREELHKQHQQLELQLKREVDPLIRYYEKRRREEFPVGEGLMPTRLGNIMAASYDYASQRYGIDAITLWPRMLPLLTQKGYDIIVKQERIKMDFFLDLCVLSIIFSFECLLIVPIGTNLWFLLGAFLSFTAAYCFYLLASAGAINLGRTIRSAFDLYRYHLLSDLYGLLPTNWEEEMELWEQLSQFFREGGIEEMSKLLHYSRIQGDVKRKEGPSAEGGA